MLRNASNVDCRHGEDQCFELKSKVSKPVAALTNSRLQERQAAEGDERSAKRQRTDESEKPLSPKGEPWLQWPVTEAVVETVSNKLQRGGKLPLAEARLLLAELKDLLAKEANVQVVTVPPGGSLTVVGDTHGQLNDLKHILTERGWPSATNRYLFNGDYVDRTARGCEVFFLLGAMKLAWPGSVHMNRGNHEDDAMNTMEG